MGKYTTYSRTKPKPPPTVHPVMRGIGCIMMIVVPILAYGVSAWLVDYGFRHAWPIPPNWSGPMDFHPLLMKLHGLKKIIVFLQGINNLEANLIFTVATMVVIGGIISMIFGFISSIFGPPRYGPQDERPAWGVKAKRYKR